MYGGVRAGERVKGTVASRVPITLDSALPSVETIGPRSHCIIFEVKFTADEQLPGV